MVYGLSYGEIDYLLAAIHVAGESTERRVDADVLLREVEPNDYEDALAREFHREHLWTLESRKMITTKGAGKAYRVGFFWITERGFEAAIEARKQGYSWPPKL